jgi:hypothetical protein
VFKKKEELFRVQSIRSGYFWVFKNKDELFWKEKGEREGEKKKNENGRLF